jgi:hypothetical protein
MLLLPLWWLFTSFSSWMMLVELRKPHHWNKTHHEGQDIEQEGGLKQTIPIV